MSPYNAYSSTLSSSYTPSTSKYTSTSYVASPPLSCRYKPPAYSSTLSSRYNSRTKFESPSTYTPSTYSSSTYTPSSISRQLSSTYISSNRVPKFTSVSSYTNAITSSSSDWKWRSSTASSDIASEKLLRSPSLSSSRRNSSTSSVATLPRIQDRSSLSSYTSGIDEPSRSSIGYKSSAENEDRTLSNLGHTSSSGRLSLISYKPLSEIEDRTGVSPGLYNLGNTCFMNSILQCLVYTEPLVDYFTNRDYVKDLKSPSNGNLTSAFHDFTSTMKNSDTSSSVRPYKLRSQVQKYAPRFSGDNQQDAQEFLRCLLQGLHDEVNRVKSRTTRRASSINDSFWSWRLYKDSDDSLITDLFAGQLQSTLKCTMCSHESITYDPFWDLSLPMPENRSNVSLRDCYSMFTSPEFLDGPDRPMCDRCQKKTRSSKQIEISIFPKILVIHLKRFSASRSGNHKIGMMVDCPLTLSSASDLASHNSFSDRCSYSLYGVVDHIGGKNAGHYVAKCRSPSMREWHEYSDARVTKVTSIITCNSYILFYTQRNSG